MNDSFATAPQNLIAPGGRRALENAALAAYAHGEYFALTKKLGRFGFSVRKRSRKQRPRNQEMPRK